ncbi:hypothetical protein E4U33_001044, partial [Claviceps sp. LM78 group G4]
LRGILSQRLSLPQRLKKFVAQLIELWLFENMGGDASQVFGGCPSSALSALKSHS